MEKEEVEIVKLLLKNNAEINAQDKEGNTPLHIAASVNKEIAEILLSAKSNVNAIDNN